jgi:hypothetical protein
VPSTSIFAMSDRDIVHIFSMPRQLLVSKIASPPAGVKKLDSFGRPSRSQSILRDDIRNPPETLANMDLQVSRESLQNVLQLSGRIIVFEHCLT